MVRNGERSVSTTAWMSSSSGGRKADEVSLAASASNATSLNGPRGLVEGRFVTDTLLAVGEFGCAYRAATVNGEVGFLRHSGTNMSFRNGFMMMKALNRMMRHILPGPSANGAQLCALFDAAAMSRVRVRDMLKGYYGTSEKEEKSQDDSIDGASPVSHTPVDLWE